jgi:hypothetical protein
LASQVRPWATPHEGATFKTFASPQQEAIERLGGPMVLTDVQPLGTGFIGEEFKTPFGTTVKYLNEREREAYRVRIKQGRLYGADGAPFDTRNNSSVFGAMPGRAIFVMDHKGNLYLSNESVVGKFHHSSFLAGAPVAAAGEMSVRDGAIESISRKSGHYRPTAAQLNQCITHLKALGVPPTFTVLSGV